MTYEEYCTCRRDYQEYGALFLLERKHCCLFYSPGKGKTYPVIDALKMLGNPKTLILSTPDAINNMWKAEIEPQGILPTDTTLMTFNSAIQADRSKKLLREHYDVICVDESHKIKSHNSKISKLVYQLTKKVEYAWGLTGTPRGNSDIDIYCQLHNLNVDQWGLINYTMFVTRCCTIDEKYFRGTKIVVPIGIKDNYQAGWEKNLSLNTQRVDYDEEDDMPPLTTNVVKLPFEKSDMYKNAEEGFIKLSDYETTMTRLTAIQKMHQIANGFIYKVDEKTGKKKTVILDHNDKIDWLKNNINEPTVIVYRFESDFELITEYLTREYISWTEDIPTFKTGKVQALVINCARCESFNLQMCRKVVFYTMDYSFLKYKQMLHRVWRKGQENETEITILLFKNSVEEDIWNTVKNKKKYADLFMSVRGNYNV